MLLASVSTTNLCLGCEHAKTRAVQRVSFTVWKGASTSGVHWKASFSSMSLVSLFAMLAKPEINHLYYKLRPRKFIMLCLFFRFGHCGKAFSFSGSVIILSGDTICPRYHTYFRRSWHFSRLTFRQASQNRRNTSRRLSRCSWNVWSNTITSSRYMRHDS
jgi:hypothetical protein